MSSTKIFAVGALLGVLCGGVALGQEQTTPPVQLAKDVSEPSLPLPRDKHGAAIEGACDVSLVVDEAGKPQKIHVVHCTDKRLKDYAEFSVAGYKFIPAKQNGRPVAAQTMIEISAHKPAKVAVENTVGQNAVETFADGVGEGFVLTEEMHEVGGGATAPIIIYSTVALWPKNFIGEPEVPKDGVGKPISVKVWADVGTDGLVHEAGILQPQYPDFEANALAAVKAYRFKPALKYGEPVAVRITVIVTFTFYRRS